MEIDQNGHSDRNIDYEIKRKKSNKNKNLTMSFLELILTKKTDIFKAINKIFRLIKQVTEKVRVNPFDFFYI